VVTSGTNVRDWGGSLPAIDAYPKEIQIHHRAGASGYGSSSYIDSMLLREKDTRDSSDAIQPPYAAADSTRDQTLYYVQNWRADVVALLNDTGRPIEHVRYTAYGSPRRLNMNPVDIAFDDGSALPPVGTASAGKVNNGVETGDYNLFLASFFDSLPAADVANDDGTPLPPFGPLGVNNGVTEGDYNLFFAKFYDGGADEPGLSAPDVANTIGYAGYEHDPILLTPSALSADPNQSSAAYYHVRHRVYDANLGRWTRRDPLGYHDGMGLYEYCKSSGIARSDPLGEYSLFAGDPTNFVPLEELMKELFQKVCFEKVKGGVLFEIPMAALQAGPDILRIAWCQKMLDYLAEKQRDHRYKELQDPYYLFLAAMCKAGTSSGRANMRKVCCIRGPGVGPNDGYGPPETVHTVCPKSYSDQQCCWFASGGHSNVTPIPCAGSGDGPGVPWGPVPPGGKWPGSPP